MKFRVHHRKALSSAAEEISEHILTVRAAYGMHRDTDAQIVVYVMGYLYVVSVHI